MRRAIFILPLLIAGIVAAGLGIGQHMRGADAAGAVLYHPSAECAANSPSITLNWSTLAGTTDQWLEISLHDNGFDEGTFTQVDLSPDQTSHTMTALGRSVPHYWRIVSDTGAGEIESNTAAFVPCGAPFLLWGPLECRNYTTAAVDFRWAPVANYAGEQFIEFDSDGNWVGADHWEEGPFSPSLETARRSGFQEGVPYLFRIVHEVDGERSVSSEGWFMPDCTPNVNPDPYGTDDQLVIPAIGVNAPVNIRDVGFDGALGVPAGGYDVIRYNFPFFPNLQGQIGGPGPTLIGGHLDYYVIGPAVFWDLAKLKAGDVIEYWDGGVKRTYVVDWVTAVPYSQPLNPYIEGSGDNTLLVVTCFGEFDRDQFGGYDQRVLVHAVPLN